MVRVVFLSDPGNLKETIEKSYHYEKLSKKSVKVSKLYQNDYITKQQIEIYKNILKDKI